jgi:hypothetical protein
VDFSTISELWDGLFQVQPNPSPAIVIATGVAAAIVVLVHAAWRWARNVITIAHEGGHAFVALLTGRRLHGIRLHRDTSGLTFTRGRRSGPSATLTLLAGYLAPALLGLFGAWLIAQGLVVLLLWLSLLLLVAMAVFIRNAYGVLAIVVTMFVVFAIAWWAQPDIQAILVYAGTWFLLLGAVRPVWEVWRQRGRTTRRDSDPDQLAEITHVPAVAWLFGFALVNVSALALGSQLLVPGLW